MTMSRLVILSFLNLTLILMVFAIQNEPQYVKFNGVTFRVQRKPKTIEKRKLPKWIEEYKEIEKRRRTASYSDSRDRAARTYKAPVETNVQRLAKHIYNLRMRSNLPGNRQAMMNYFYNNPFQQGAFNKQNLPSLNNLISQSYYTQMLQKERLDRMYRRQRMNPQRGYVNQQVDKKDLIRSPYYYPYSRFPYYNWRMYNRQNTRSYIPNYYSSSQPQAAFYTQRSSNTQQKKSSINPSITRNNALTGKIGKGSGINKAVTSAPSTKLIENQKQSTFQKPIISKDHPKSPQIMYTSNKYANTQKFVNNMTSQKSRNATTHQPTISSSLKHHAFHKTNVSARHRFHKTPNGQKLASKREYLSSPETNSFEDETGEFPMEENGEDEPQQEFLPENPLERDEELNIAREETPEPETMDMLQSNAQDTNDAPEPEMFQSNVQGTPLLPGNANGAAMLQSNAQGADELESAAQLIDTPQINVQNTPSSNAKVPLLNIETPDMSGIPNAVKGGLKKSDQQYMKQPTQNTGDTRSNSEGSPRKTSKKEDSSNEEEDEAKKEEKEAKSLMAIDIDNLKVNPEMAGGDIMPQNTDERIPMNLAQRNIASPNNEINMGSSLMNQEHPGAEFTSPREGPQNGKYDSNSFGGGNKSPEFITRHELMPSGENAEETISRLQQNDYFDSKKLVKSLSGLKEPPENIALGEEKVEKLKEEDDQENLLDPVKTQERARKLEEQFERRKENDKEMQGGIEPSNSRSKGLSPEDAMNALDGKPIPHIEHNMSNQNMKEQIKDPTESHFISNNMEDQKMKEQIKSPTESNFISNNMQGQKMREQMENPTESHFITSNTRVESHISDQHLLDAPHVVRNETQHHDDTTKSAKLVEKPSSMKENLVKQNITENTKPANQSDISSKTLANATTTQTSASPTISQVANLIKGIAMKHNENGKSTVDSEERETKEAVKDLSVAIGILEKKLELINQTKANDTISSNVSPEREPGHAIRSDIDLSNSLKVLEKVINVATRVGKRKKPSTSTAEERSKVQRDESERQRNEIPHLNYINQMPYHSYYDRDVDNNDVTNNYEQLEDAKRNRIAYPDTFIVSAKNKRTNIPYFNQVWKRRFVRPYFNTYQQPAYFWGRRLPYFYRSR